jgi:twitching motility protein PilT
MDRTHLEELLASLVRSGGSSLYLIAGQPPCLRMHGRLVRAEGERLTAQVLQELTREFLFADHRQRLERGEEVEILYCSSQGVRFRTSVARQNAGLSLVFRSVPDRVPTLESLALPEQVAGFLEFRRGLVLVTGFVGSGRSTTLASMVDHINDRRAVHVVTLENPIEFIHTHRRALIHQRQIGTHVDSIARGARDAIAQGADVLCVNEIRTPEDLDAVLEASERGLLVLATWHGSSIVGGLADLMQSVPAEDVVRTRRRLAASLRAMMSQSLLTRRHDQGRVPLVEILIRSDAVARTIRAGDFDDLRELMARGRGLGMQTVDAALRQLLNANHISLEEAQYHAEERDWLTARTR